MKRFAFKQVAILAAAIAAALALMLTACAPAGPEGPDYGGSSPSAAPESGGGMQQMTGDFGSLEQVRYSESGNSLGNMYYIETATDDDGMPIVRVADSPQHDVPAEIKEYRMPDGLLERIDELASEAGMKTWGDLPMGDLVPLDAATPTLMLEYASADADDDFPIWLSFTAWDEFPEGGLDAFYRIRDELAAVLSQSDPIRTYTEALLDD